MNHCDTCRSWKPIRHTNFGECKEPKLLHEVTPPVDGLAQEDALGLPARLYPGPHFGCVHWKAGKGRKAA